MSFLLLPIPSFYPHKPEELRFLLPLTTPLSPTTTNSQKGGGSLFQKALSAAGTHPCATQDFPSVLQGR